MKSIVLIVCANQVQAEIKVGFLEAQGYVAKIEDVTDFIAYDAAQFGGGKQDDPTGKWLVIARKAEV